MSISIIIPAFNESPVIRRCLDALHRGSAEPIEVIVVCNGCSDGTAAEARSAGAHVKVIESKTASKAHALNLGDAAASGFPRIYLDADVVLPGESLQRLVQQLQTGKSMVAAPRTRWDLSGASWAVRCFYAIDGLLPSSRHGIGGSGVYALSEQGRARFGPFPLITADDAFVRSQFSPGERAVVEDAFSIVTPPKRLWGVIVIKSRSHFGNRQIAVRFPHLILGKSSSNWPVLLRLAMNPRRWIALAIYGVVKVVARLRSTWKFRFGDHTRWERDATSREPTSPARAAANHRVKFDQSIATIDDESRVNA